jgi:predicted dienelactone hydrolase
MKKIIIAVVVIVIVLFLIIASKKKNQNGNGGPPPPPVSGGCPGTFDVGYKVEKISGRTVAVWYPSTDSEKSIKYTSDFSGSVAKDGSLRTDCGKFPLVVFSHGYAGCSLQSVFFTEQLARNGYIVAAPDHNDASCSASGGAASPNFGSEPSLFEPQKWTESNYTDRKNDVQNVISSLTKDGTFGNQIGKIGVAGHSLGGYTAAALAGGW